MKSRALNDTSWLVVFAGEEVIASLTSFVAQQGIAFGAFTAVGSFSRGTLAWWDATTRAIVKEDFTEQFEVASFSGNVTAAGSGTPPPPQVHAHTVLANGTIIRAGHVLAAFAYPELELVLTTPSALQIRRVKDPETNLWLMDL
jgi:predicted DNA-binding protein with PD1-like motif